jgi:N-acetylglucosamine kinase-like BadF-type ATPase
MDSPLAKVVLGVDGGQTSTTAAVCDLTGKLLGIGRAGPANHVWEPGGEERARRAVAESTAEALSAAGLPATTQFAAAFLGLPGPADPLKLRAAQGSVRTARFRMENDKVNALASVTAGKPGVVVIAGTGTITYGENARGESADASGWGYLLGDEGGAFWIAKQAVAAACRHWDGRGEPTQLTERLLVRLGIKDLWELYFLVYSEKLSRADIAGLAKVVPEAASEGDRVAAGILRRTGRELGLAAGAVARRLRLHRDPVMVGMVGGVFRGSSEVGRAFRREIRRHVPKAVFVEPRFTPVIGSVLLALKLAHVRLTGPVLQNLATASDVVGAK